MGKVPRWAAGLLLAEHVLFQPAERFFQTGAGTRKAHAHMVRQKKGPAIADQYAAGICAFQHLIQSLVDVYKRQVLTLSATPIPRTLNMAMSGIRDMSTIEEPPFDRQPVETYVLEYEDGVIEQAVRKELSRGGQVYYLHNRIDSIERCAAHLAELVPEARIGLAHGRMGEDELSTVWQRLLDGEIDILVCLSLIHI